MCGIFALINGDVDPVKDTLLRHIEKNKKRGPEVEKYSIYGKQVFFAFHRLAINGLGESGDQPLVLGKNIIVANGEIFNFKELMKTYNITPKGNSDIEVILHLYEMFGMNMLSMINGEFSFVLYDGVKNKIIVARDQFGIRPLYYNVSKVVVSHQNMHITTSDTKMIYSFSSTLSSLVDMEKMKNSSIQQFQPGHYMTLDYNDTSKQFEFESLQQYIYLPPTIQHKFMHEDVYSKIYDSLKSAVERRILTSDRPVGALLSGGLDSSLICALSQKILRQHGRPPLETFSIGLHGSEDLKFSKMVAKHIGSNHHQINMTEDEFLNAIPNVIKDIESYDTTTVRASTGNWLIGKYIKSNSMVKVVLNGDGADELMGGYLYFHKAPNNHMFDEECKRLLSNIHFFDVLRSDRSISSHGLEPRTPFLDKDFVHNYLSVDVSSRNHNIIQTQHQTRKAEKSLIRETIQAMDPNLLPHDILWRQKEAFSDGVSSVKKSWFQVIQDDIKNRVDNNIKLAESIENTIYPEQVDCDSLEQKYYYILFKNSFSNCEKIIPYYWMPRFIEAKDSSARTLKTIYDSSKSNTSS